MYKPNYSQQFKFKERIIKMVEMVVDPIEPSKFKRKKLPRAYGSPPVPLMHSPPRPLTVKDQQDWKIPSCISNWKKPKGYTIPLDRRLASDGRGLQEAHVNDNLAKLSEALCCRRYSQKSSCNAVKSSERDYVERQGKERNGTS